jgi:endoglycosylceramidase
VGRRWLSGVCAAAFAAALGMGSPPLARAGAVAPWVTTSGIRFVDAGSGNPVILRGVNVGAGPNQTLQQKVQQMGANLVRIHACWSDLEPSAPTSSGHTWNESLFSGIATQVDWYQQHHINVLLDLHQFNWSSYFSGRGCGIPAWFYSQTKAGEYPATPGGEVRAFTDFYRDRDAIALYREVVRQLVTRFDGYPAVLGYEILNEPYGPNTHEGTQDILSFEAKMRRTIQSIDPRRTVFVMTRNGGDKGLLDASFAAFGSLKHVALDYHDYFAAVPGTGMTFDGENWSPGWDATHLQMTTNYRGSAALQRDMLDFPVHKSWDLGVPVLIGEWGARRDDRNGTAYQSQMLRIFGDLGLSWARWSLSANDKFGLLSAQGQPTSDYTQLAAAMATRPAAPAMGPTAPAFALSSASLRRGHTIRLCFRLPHRARQVVLGVRTSSGARVRTRRLGAFGTSLRCDVYKGHAANGHALPLGHYMLRVSAAYTAGGSRFSVWRPLQIRS